MWWMHAGRLLAASHLEDVMQHEQGGRSFAHPQQHAHSHGHEAPGAGLREACMAWLLSCPALVEQLDLSCVTLR